MQTVTVEKLTPFLVIVVLNPTQKDVFDTGAVPRIILQPTAVLARDEQQASAKAMRLIGEEDAKNIDRLEVSVFQFRRTSA